MLSVYKVGRNIPWLLSNRYMQMRSSLFLSYSLILLLFSCENKLEENSKSEVPDAAQIRENNTETKDSTAVKALVPEAETVKDLDENEYNTVKIGQQTWMVKNLKTTQYNDGTPIPLIKDGEAWAALSAPGYCWYDNEESSFKPSYGALYNGYAVNTGKLCPMGWHLPTNAEWTALITYLGSESIAGEKMKETGTSYWVSPNTGATNESGFTALPGGLRYHDGSFYDFGFSGYWWSSTEYSPSRAFFIYMDHQSNNVFRFDNLKKLGFSVRCVKDN